jgi:penicillin-binding protein 1A
MRAAHQGVPVAALPGSRSGGLFSNVAQVTPQAGVASASPAPASLAPPATGRAAATRGAVRPEAAAGLDGWLMERLFGRR